MQSSCAHHVPQYNVQALRARGKRAVVLPLAFGLQALRRKRCTARRIGGCDKHCEYNDAQPGRFSHGRRDRDVRYARTIVNAHYES